MTDSPETTVNTPRVEDFAERFFTRQVSLPIAVGGASHAGHRRAENEDHFAIFRITRSMTLLHGSLSANELPTPEHEAYSLVVADGMGGMRSGEQASRLAVTTMLQLAGQATSWVMRLNDPDSQQIQQRVEAYVSRIHQTLREQGEADPERLHMGTTWTSAHLLGEHAVIVHLGDSRAYHWRQGRMHQVTKDETMAQSLIDSGMAPQSVSKFRHILMNSFGGGNSDARAQIHHVKFLPGDQLLLCTDGLTDMVPDQDIAEQLDQQGAPQQACDALLKQALDAGGRDNVTVIIAKGLNPGNDQTG